MHYVIISCTTLLVGMLFYGIYNELIIIRLPYKSTNQPIMPSNAQRKNSKLIYWNKEAFITEEKELLIPSDTLQAFTDLTNSWLTLLEEEQVMQKKVSLQSGLLDDTGQHASLSFDRNPLPKKQSTYQKLMFIEGLLKTVQASGLPIKSVRFFAHHKPLQDTHLDFNHPWPISGYLDN